MEHTRRILEKDEIRVLAYDSELTRNSGVLACRTKILQLSDVDPNGTLSYAAISYVWGDPGITSPLICDGATVSVTSNLLEALSTIWKGYPWRQLWADAISITQDNLAERNHQVSLMGDIFRSADNVFVSLGPALRGGNLYWNLLKSFMTRGRFDGEEFEEQLDEFMEGADNELAMGFDDLIHRPWFRRAWVSAFLSFGLDCPYTSSLRQKSLLNLLIYYGTNLLIAILQEDLSRNPSGQDCDCLLRRLVHVVERVRRVSARFQQNRRLPKQIFYPPYLFETASIQVHCVGYARSRNAEIDEQDQPSTIGIQKASSGSPCGWMAKRRDGCSR